MMYALTDLVRSRRGNVGATFALALVPILGAMGVAIDYSRASSASARLQVAVDAAALALAKLPATTGQPALNEKALAIIKEAMDGSVVAGSLVVNPPDRGTSTLTVKANAKHQITLSSVLSVQPPTIAAESTVTWGNTRLRVALVLDVTGSMRDDGKMTAMKAAAQNLLKQLKDAAISDGDVYVSIIPFAKDVNAKGLANIESYIKWSGDSDTWDENNGTCKRWGGNRTGWVSTSHSTKASCNQDGYTWTPDAHSTWNGCVMDRDRNYDTTNTPPTTSSTNFPAEQDGYCPTSMMGLSYDWTALNNKITALQPNGGTNQGIGLAWGFQSLTASPFTVPPKDDKYQYSQVIILLSDGLNTLNRYWGDGQNNDSRIDARQKILCDNIKAAGVKLYTVQVNTDKDPTSTLLQGCATDASKFFLLTSAAQIVTTFKQIGTDLSSLRVSK